MTENHGWRSQAKCAKYLTPQQADALFFPTAGGKPNKAKIFCSTCPFKTECLLDAIENKLLGYFAGTTDDERRLMAPLHKITPHALPLPPEPASRRIYRKVFSPDDTHKWLDDDNLEPSPTELLELEQAS